MLIRLLIVCLCFLWPAMAVGANSPTFRSTGQRTGSAEPLPTLYLLGEAWRVQTEGPIRSSPVLAGDRLFIGSSDGSFRALNAASGAELWRFDAGAPVTGTAAVDGDTVYLTDRNSILHALDIRDGKERWRAATESAPRLPGSWDYFASSPAVDGKAVYFGAGDGHVVAVARSDGRQLWRFRTGGQVRSSPLIDGRYLIVGSADGSLYRLRTSDGGLDWRFDSDGRSLDPAKWGYDRTTIQASPALAGDVVVVGGRDGTVYGIDRGNGKQLWKKENGTGWIVSSAAIAGPRAIIGSSDGKFVQALDTRSGTELWRVPIGGNAIGSALIAGDVAIVGSFDGRLRALDIATGALRWSIQAGGKILASPAASNHLLYSASDDGALVAFRARPEQPQIERVYYDEKGPGWRWSTFNSGPVRSRLEAAGYRPVDEAGLRAFMLRHGEAGRRSAIIFLSDRLPAAAMDEAAGVAPLRRYLQAGGKAVWMGYPPGIVDLDPASGEIARWDTARTKRLIDVAVPGTIIGEYRAAANAAGRRWGLRPWLAATLPMLPNLVSEVLATDEAGLAAAWVKSFGGPEGSGFVQLWSTQDVAPDADEMIRVAEFGL